jgi:ADP-heptose:LPS heptosyltransferase
MHIGAATQTPVIGLFGPTYPEELAAITHKNSLYIWKGPDLQCSPCYKNGKFPECPYDKKCMRMISPKEVFQSMKEIIDEGA